MDFYVVYDISQAVFSEWMFDVTSAILIIIIVFAVFLFLKKFYNNLVLEYLRFLIIPFIILIVLGIIWNIFTYKTYLNVKNKYKNNDSIKIVEGYVANVHLQYGRMNKQFFQVGKESFEISENIYTGGFDKTVQKGGPIKEGLYVRINYIEQPNNMKIICKVEIRN